MISPLQNSTAAAYVSALVLPRPDLAVISVTGGDRLSWLNGMLTCELESRKPGAAVYGLALVKVGKVIADVIVVVDEGRVIVVAPAEVRSQMRASLDHFLIMEDAEMAETNEAIVHVHGPRSGEVLEAARAHGALGGALDPTGLGGSVLVVPQERSAEVNAAIERAVAEVSGAFGGAAAWETLRLERRVPRFGVDFDQATFPQEGRLETSAVSFSKGCYLGQEVVCMLEMRGRVKRRLAALVLDEGASVPARGAPVTDALGAVVGEITSAVFSPRLARAVAIAMIKRAHTEPGTALTIAGSAGVVVERPVD